MSVTGPGCGLGFAYAYTADELAAWRASLAPEDDFRPLPSVAEVLAHNARTGGGFTSPWLCIRGEDDEYSDVRVVSLSVGLAFDGERDEVCGGADADTALYRPITRRGGALPWPEVPR